MMDDDVFKIEKHVVGRKIIDLKIDCPPIQQNNESELENDQGEIYLYLDNGKTIVCWNSEWGGVHIRDKGEE